MYFLQNLISLCTLYELSITAAILMLWMNRKESIFGFSALTTLLAITFIQCFRSLWHDAGEPLPLLENLITWPLLLVFLSSFAQTAQQRTIHRQFAALVAFLSLLIWANFGHDATIFAIISGIGLLLCIISCGYLFAGMLQSNVYQDHRDTGNMLMLASTLLILSCYLIILMITNMMQLNEHALVMNIAKVLGTIWCIMLCIGLSLIRKGRRQPMVAPVRAWKEEPESFRFL